MSNDDDFEEFERMLEGSEYLDISNPNVQNALRYAAEQRQRLLDTGHPDYRLNARQPDFPFPEQDNAMLDYLVHQTQTVNDEDDFTNASLWLAVHAWFEGALWALSKTVEKNGEIQSDDDRQLVITHLTNLDEAIEMLRSVETLGLGARLHNSSVLQERDEDEESELRREEWVLDVLDAPLDVDE